jgi:hypothetical protein
MLAYTWTDIVLVAKSPRPVLRPFLIKESSLIFSIIRSSQIEAQSEVEVRRLKTL